MLSRDILDRLRREKAPGKPWCFFPPWSWRIRARAEVLHWARFPRGHDILDIQRHLRTLGIRSEVINPHEG